MGDYACSSSPSRSSILSLLWSAFYFWILPSQASLSVSSITSTYQLTQTSHTLFPLPGVRHSRLHLHRPVNPSRVRPRPQQDVGPPSETGRGTSTHGRPRQGLLRVTLSDSQTRSRLVHLCRQVLGPEPYLQRGPGEHSQLHHLRLRAVLLACSRKSLEGRSWRFPCQSAASRPRARRDTLFLWTKSDGEGTQCHSTESDGSGKGGSEVERMVFGVFLGGVWPKSRRGELGCAKEVTVKDGNHIYTITGQIHNSWATATLDAIEHNRPLPPFPFHLLGPALVSPDPTSTHRRDRLSEFARSSPSGRVSQPLVAPLRLDDRDNLVRDCISGGGWSEEEKDDSGWPEGAVKRRRGGSSSEEGA